MSIVLSVYQRVVLQVEMINEWSYEAFIGHGMADLFLANDNMHVWPSPHMFFYQFLFTHMALPSSIFTIYYRTNPYYLALYFSCIIKLVFPSSRLAFARGKLYTDKAVVMRCLRPDGSLGGTGAVLHGDRTPGIRPCTGVRWRTLGLSPKSSAA